MPYAKRTFRPRRRFVARRRKKPNVNRRSLRPTRSLGKTIGIPDRMFVKVKYVDTFGMSYAGSGAPGVKEYRVNSPYDPDYTGIGHQPLFWDQYAALYKRYRCYGCKYLFKIFNYDNANQSEVILTLKEQTAVHTVWSTICEQTYTQCRVVDIEGGKSHAYISGYADMAKITGAKKSTIANDMDFQSEVTANPLRQAFMSLQHQGLNGASGNITVTVELVYYVSLFDRVLPTAS